MKITKLPTTTKKKKSPETDVTEKQTDRQTITGPHEAEGATNVFICSLAYARLLSLRSLLLASLAYALLRSLCSLSLALLTLLTFARFANFRSLRSLLLAFAGLRSLTLSLLAFARFRSHTLAFARCHPMLMMLWIRNLASQS